MNFDMQQFLTDMRREQHEAHEKLEDKIDDIKTITSSHETRLVVIEHGRHLVKWAIGLSFGAVVSLLLKVLGG
jgi:hypothetical protein